MRIVSILALLLCVPLMFGQEFRLMSDKDHATYREYLPATDDAGLKELFAKPLTFYSDREMPRAYQHGGGVHSPLYNISALGRVARSHPRYEPHGNANVEFPWGAPAGTHRSDNASAFRFVHLPGPITYWRTTRPRIALPGYESVIEWSYPDGTTFGEVLLIADGKTHWPFEVRTRVKNAGKWAMNVFRPFPNRPGLAARLNSWGVDLGPPRLRKGRLFDKHPTKTVIDREALLDDLPDLPPEIVRRLLAEPFVSALGQEWHAEDGLECHAPTTNAAFSIVPKHYDGAYLKVDSKSCMACHEGTLTHADAFDARRDWYGLVRGSDAIFSFHPFDPSCISDNGVVRPVVMRRELVKAGLLRGK